MRLISKIIGNQERPVSNSGGVVEPITTNPNLLDNPWFTVNQRGLSVYPGTEYANKFVFDRWSMRPDLNTSCSAGISSNGMSASLGTNNVLLFNQGIEDDLHNLLIGKTITVSIKYSGSIYSVTTVYKADTVEYFYVEPNLRLGVGNSVFRMVFDADYSNIRAVKLEIGSTSTLHLDTVPDYSTELLKCQRYFRRLTPVSNNEVIASGFTWGTGNALCYAPIVPTMRATPTLTTSGTFSFKTYTTTVSSVSIQRDSGCSASLLGLYISKASSFTDNVVGSLIGTSSSYIDLDAEL